ncbi:MAG: hypothetical protein H0U73_12115 [Tatlockia sp.]|nr:hypothetical protein [Tatlockia sp.]
MPLVRISFCRSFSTKLIAEKMSLSVRTVEVYIINNRIKLNVNSKHEIIDHCIKNSCYHWKIYSNN